MKKVFIYSIIALLAGCVASCNKNENTLQDGSSIRFAFGAAETRALVNTGEELQAAQTVQVYDFLDGTQYFGEPVEYVSTAWTFVSGKGYTWKTGENKFFAYTNNAAFGTLGTDQTVSVSKVLTTADADQEDILYSDIVTKTKVAGTAINDAVEIPMNHLFAAVSIALENVTDKTVTVTSVSKPAIPNSSSATVNFGGEETVVTYSTDGVAPSGDFVTADAISDGSIELAQNEMIDVLAMAKATAKKFYVVWPQTLPGAEEASEAGEEGEGEGEGEEVEDTHLFITVNYTVPNEEGTVEAKTAKVRLPADTWVAGHKYSYVLRFLPTKVQLIFKVMPWDEPEGFNGGINTKTGSINMSNVTWMNTKIDIDGDGVYGEYDTETYIGEDGKEKTRILLDENTVNNSTYSVTMFYHPTVVGGTTYTANHGYLPAQGYFTVNYPTDGLFKIDLIPAYGQTEADLDKTQYEIVIYDYSSKSFRDIDPDGEDLADWKETNAQGTVTGLNTIYFQVRATGKDSAAHKAQIDIWFKPDGSDEWISAYSEIRANYALVIPAR